MNLRISQARRGLTMVEAIVSVAVFSLMTVALASLIQTGMGTSVLVGEQTRTQAEAERILRAVRDQLIRSGTSPTAGNLVYTPFPSTNSWEIAFNKMNLDPIPDPIAPANLAALWDTTRYVIKWEHPTDPMTGGSIGVDNDNDYIVDDGRVAIYRRVATDQLIAVIGDNVTDFSLGSPAGLVSGTRPRLQLRVTVERLLQSGIKNAADAAAARAGGGPRVRHTADLWVVFNN